MRFQTILMSESANIYSPCHKYMYQIQMLFRNDLSNPIATHLGSEIDVSFIIATHYFSFFLFFGGLTVLFFLSADHKTSHHSSFFFIICSYENSSREPHGQSYCLVDLDCRSQIRTFSKIGFDQPIRMVENLFDYN